MFASVVQGRMSQRSVGWVLLSFLGEDATTPLGGDPLCDSVIRGTSMCLSGA